MECKRKIYKKIIYIIIMLLCITIMLTQIVKICVSNRCLKKSNKYQVVSLEEPICEKQFENIIKKTASNVVGGYCYDENANISPKGIVRSVTVPLIAITFSNIDFLPATANLNVDDKKGCMVDKDTMYALFGTERSSGQILIYNENEYQVRGILLTDRPLVVIQNDKSDAMLDSIVVNVKNELYRNQFRDSELASYPLKNEGFYVADYNRMSHWLETPNQWSDFVFFKNFYRQICDRWEHIFYDNKDAVECIFYKTMIIRFYRELVVLVVAIVFIFLVCNKKRLY